VLLFPFEINVILRLRINKSLLAYAIIEFDTSFDDCVKIAPSPRGLAGWAAVVSDFRSKNIGKKGNFIK